MTKYRNKPTVIDGKRFASQKEARRYRELRLLEDAGKISNLKTQVRIQLIPGIVYVADATYTENGEEVIEDVKGYRTQVYRLKAKLFKHVFGKEIKEV